MKPHYNLNTSQIIILNNVMRSLDEAGAECYELKDNAGYNRFMALKLNIKEMMQFFEKRRQKDGL